jgi:cyd operon protein YbgT
MWYFTWVLGLGFACAFAVLNAMWLELSPGEVPAE